MILTHGSLFSGIGGFDLAAEWMGWENVFHCEWNEFGRKVLNYYWPKANSHGDITKTDFSIYRGKIDILTGGFPCQPYSQAGKRLGKEDERHLWPEMLRAIREIQPTYIVGENVRGIINWNEGLVFEEVHDQLEAEGYEIQSFLLPAASCGAVHERQRTYFCAYSNSFGLERRKDGTYAKNREWESSSKKQFKGFHKRTLQSQFWPSLAARFCFVDNGISKQLDGITFREWRQESLKAAGNAVVPQVIFNIFQAIKKHEELVISKS